jgi:hypothetical protein
VTGYESTHRLLQLPVYEPSNDPTFLFIAPLFDMRLGPDGIIYIKQILSSGNKISIIKSPNTVGFNCDYNDLVYDMGTTLMTDLSRRVPEIPFDFNLDEEIIGCLHSISIQNLAGYGPYTYHWSTVV